MQLVYIHKNSFKILFIVLGVFFNSFSSIAQDVRVKIPDVYSNIKYEDSRMLIEFNGEKYYEVPTQAELTLENLKGSPKGTKKGLAFDFRYPGFDGIMYYGFIPFGDSKHPQPVFFRAPASIKGGKTTINIKDVLKGTYDMVGWETSGKGTLGYRVVSNGGEILYDGIISFKGTGPFKVDDTIIEGPFVNRVTPEGATISFETNHKLKATVTVGDISFSESKSVTHHEVELTGLSAATEYSYTVHYGENSVSYSFETSPPAGTRSAFTFAYASDSRAGQGGGERDVYGANYYIMKKIMALARFKKVAFSQFSGDLINGYLQSPDEIEVQYANWKRAVEPFAHYFPVYISMGNHEALTRLFVKEGGRVRFSVDRFPFETESAEAIFGKNFVNPLNGPASEDGAYYDPNPNPKKIDFPSYEENVFYYTYDNVAVIVMNSDYWYAPPTNLIPYSSGGMHGYIMDNQLAWLDETVATLEKDNNIDHIFLTQHTPFFPNGGHTRDDMWYKGDNSFRPYVAGKPVKKGIIERRDQLLDIVVNKSTKVIGILTGDEHNYARTEIGAETNIYPENYPEDKKVKLSRTIYQINNGAAGAPYYAQEETPWTPFVSGFTTQNALVLFHIEGKKIRMEVLNPDTLEEVDELEMR